MMTKNISPYLKTYFAKELPDTCTKIFDLTSFVNCKIAYNENPFNALRMICTGGDPDYDYPCLLQDALNLGVNVNHYHQVNNELPVLCYTVSGRPDLALLLIENGAYNDEFKEVLKKQGYPNIISFALDFHTDKKFVDDKIKLLDVLYQIEGIAPDFIASEIANGKCWLQNTNSLPVIKWLLDKGANPLLCSPSSNLNSIDYWKKQHSTAFENMEIIKLMKQAAIKIKAQNNAAKILQQVNHKFDQKNPASLLKKRNNL